MFVSFVRQVLDGLQPKSSTTTEKLCKVEGFEIGSGFFRGAIRNGYYTELNVFRFRLFSGIRFIPTTSLLSASHTKSKVMLMHVIR